MTRPFTAGEDVALFIDWENFKISLATGHRTPNVSALKEEVSNLGRVVVAKAYADWVSRAPEIRGASQFIYDPPALYAAGIEPVYVPTRIFSGNSRSTEPPRGPRIKNSIDVKMTADCLESAHSYPNIGTYVLVSGDSDFIHVVNTLRTMGKQVVIIGVSWSTSRRLADQVDGLILYDVDVDPVIVPEPAPAGNGRGPARGDEVTRVELAEVIRVIEDIVRTERQAGGNPLLTSIKQRVVRRIPAFDEKKLGFSGFKKLMARVAREGNIRLVTHGLVDWAIMADEPDPDEGEADSIAPQEARPAQAGGRRRFKPVEAQPAAEESHDAPDEQHPPVTPSEPADAPGPSVAAPAAAPPATATAQSLEAVISGATADADMPTGPGDGLDAQRAADLIVMAETLQHREGISHVAFNFLVGEVCQALEQGLEAEDVEITRRWAQAYTRAYVSRMFRGLNSANMFKRGWHSWRDETSGHQRRRRTFTLDLSHPVVEQVLKSRWGSSHDGDAADAAPGSQELEPGDGGYDSDGVADGFPQEEAAPRNPVRVEVPFLSRFLRSRRGD